MCSSNKVCDYCNKTVVNSVPCQGCQKAYFHDSCAKRIMNKDSIVKCSACKESEVKGRSRNLRNSVSSGSQEQINDQSDKNLVKMFQELQKSMQFMSDKFDQITADNRKFLTEMKELRNENDALKKQINQLQGRMNELEMEKILCNVEILGTQISGTADVKATVMEIANDLLQCNMKEEVFLQCQRKDTKQGTIIIAKLLNPEAKAKLLQSRKKSRLTSNMLKCNRDNQSNQTQIYINESLSPQNRSLFNLAYKIKKQKGYRYLWTKNGKVYLRKQENDPVLYIRSEEILNQLQ